VIRRAVYVLDGKGEFVVAHGCSSVARGRRAGAEALTRLTVNMTRHEGQARLVRNKQKTRHKHSRVLVNGTDCQTERENLGSK
jgi:hypothetical protein